MRPKWQRFKAINYLCRPCCRSRRLSLVICVRTTKDLFLRPVFSPLNFRRPSSSLRLSFLGLKSYEGFSFDGSFSSSSFFSCRRSSSRTNWKKAIYSQAAAGTATAAVAVHPFTVLFTFNAFLFSLLSSTSCETADASFSPSIYRTTWRGAKCYIQPHDELNRILPSPHHHSIHPSPPSSSPSLGRRPEIQQDGLLQSTSSSSRRRRRRRRGSAIARGSYTGPRALSTWTPQSGRGCCWQSLPVYILPHTCDPCHSSQYR